MPKAHLHEALYLVNHGIDEAVRGVQRLKKTPQGVSGGLLQVRGWSGTSPRADQRTVHARNETLQSLWSGQSTAICSQLFPISRTGTTL
jgi:hypothetical protein